jgi:hypothetical protein
MDGRKNHVRTAARVLDHRIGGVVDEVGVVASSTDHDVGADAAVEEIVAGVAIDGVRQAVAVTLQVA